MIEREAFDDMMDELIEELPSYCFWQLNGGIHISNAVKFHEKSNPQNPMYIMGEYQYGAGRGRRVVIYYGSFEVLYGHLSDDELKRCVRKTLRHEFVHHMESLAGERDLEIEDAIRINKYLSE